MHLNSETFQEAKLAARIPRYQYIMVGVIAAAIVPTMYMKRYARMHIDKAALEDINNIKKEGNFVPSSAESVKKDILNKRELDKDLLMTHQPAVWSIKGNNKITNDPRFRELVDENAMILFSSIM
ncbi:hypothetical protein TPHA_0A05140 [Tetrapisispora phaffii CBS 4417]|uniref:Uncharacterized protein n=1 Tax=Tetrapisispora phaffii (strain ATCC 24235 / CBS 4417 / NBRC 1672 / NRRL Y-8282 / UCD 70-5) TaxID=1071381 RepID=G8BNW1_TETPH|nr:hypothetical protein TPHA_0A05140 [Tetrapisispora phaffii CBS 4417]CCE61589.1 hypothetical protein TPHA_0A05140 [Tetrapisispora phaffii CBS 4417]